MLPAGEVKSRRGDLDRVAGECLGKNPALARLLEASEPAGEWKTVSDIVVKVSVPIRPGILFAGDSQGTVDPLGGQGMTMALLGAEMLVPFVELGLASAEGITDPIQAACHDEWHRRFSHRVALPDLPPLPGQPGVRRSVGEARPGRLEVPGGLLSPDPRAETGLVLSRIAPNPASPLRPPSDAIYPILTEDGRRDRERPGVPRPPPMRTTAP